MEIVHLHDSPEHVLTLSVESLSLWLILSPGTQEEKPIAGPVPSLRVPGGMRRPPMACGAAGFQPLAKTGRADSSGIEGVPGMQARTAPAALFGRRPAAQRTADARPGRPASLPD